jgi:hypothetical protein
MSCEVVNAGKSMLNAIRTVRIDAWNSTAAGNGAGMICEVHMATLGSCYRG